MVCVTVSVIITVVIEGERVSVDMIVLHSMLVMVTADGEEDDEGEDWRLDDVGRDGGGEVGRGAVLADELGREVVVEGLGEEKPSLVK